MSKNHDIEIRLTDGHAFPVLPVPGLMEVGDTVRYFSKDGAARVEFTDASPFGNDAPDSVPGGETRTLTVGGIFFCKCFVTPPGNKLEIGWFEGEEPQSGGDHDVKPHS